MKAPPLGPGGEDINWPDQVAPRGQKASSTRKIKPQTSNLMMSSGMTSSVMCPITLHQKQTFHIHILGAGHSDPDYCPHSVA